MAPSKATKRQTTADSDREGEESSDDEFANATQQAKARQQRRDSDNEEQDEDDSDDAMDEDSDGDAEQTLDDKRRLRRDYRELQHNMEENQTEWVKQHSTGLYDTLKKANSLFETVSTTQEAYLDSRILTSAARLSVVKVNNMKLSGRALDTQDFLRRIRRKLTPANARDHEDDDEDALDWTSMRTTVLVCGFAAPSIDFMYGPLAVEPKARKEIKRNGGRINKDLSQLQKPQQLQESDIQKQENETSKSVAKIMKVLQQTGAINFFEFVINPNSFSQSVENIFYVSFLIRDGHVAIDIEDGQPILRTVQPNQAEDDEEGGAGSAKKQQKQHIIELSYDSYQ
ncbi:nuclear protein, partial [Podochytrium sp. JEL0797]